MRAGAVSGLGGGDDGGGVRPAEAHGMGMGMGAGADVGSAAANRTGRGTAEGAAPRTPRGEGLCHCVSATARHADHAGCHGDGYGHGCRLHTQARAPRGIHTHCRWQGPQGPDAPHRTALHAPRVSVGGVGHEGPHAIALHCTAHCECRWTRRPEARMHCAALRCAALRCTPLTVNAEKPRSRVMPRSLLWGCLSSAAVDSCVDSAATASRRAGGGERVCVCACVWW